jgi:DNA topoisomerase-1
LLYSEIIDFCSLGSWKEIRHDNTVTWLAYWNDPINPKLFKYVFLAASSSWKGQSDKEKYEKARMLKVPSCFVYQLY